jgi:hypothetical protein
MLVTQVKPKIKYLERLQDRRVLEIICIIFGLSDLIDSYTDTIDQRYCGRTMEKKVFTSKEIEIYRKEILEKMNSNIRS